MRTRNVFIGFGVLVTILCLGFLAPRMVLQGSLLDEQRPSSSSSSSPEPEFIADPLSPEALKRVQYTVADASVRFALSAAGQTFGIAFDDDGNYLSPGTSAMKRPGIQAAVLRLEKVAFGDMDGDRRPDSAVPISIRIGDTTFTEVALVRNKGDDAGEYIGGYPLGLGAHVQNIALRRDGTMVIRFAYIAPGETRPVDARITVDIAKAEALLD